MSKIAIYAQCPDWEGVLKLFTLMIIGMAQIY